MLLGDPGGVKEATEHVVAQLFKTLSEASPSKPDAPKFFPHGIEVISVDVQVGVVKVSLRMEGPKATSE
jgi:hypothetical protein